MKKLGIGLLVLIACLYGCYAAVVTTGSWRYRLTLTVNDNGEVYTGSSVIEVSVLQGLEFLPEMHPLIKVHGEAVAVDIGEKGTLFALLSKGEDRGYANTIVCIIFPMDPKYPCDGSLTPQGIRYYRNLEGKSNVPFEKLPMLIHFGDINDPKTVKEVNPNDLESTFGSGVSLESATIEMTDDSVTTGIENKIKWLEEWKNRGGNIFGKEIFDSPPPPIELLLPMDFKEP